MVVDKRKRNVLSSLYRRLALPLPMFWGVGYTRSILSQAQQPTPLYVQIEGSEQGVGNADVYVQQEGREKPQKQT